MNNVLSIFSPSPAVPRAEFASSDLSALVPNGIPPSLTNFDNATALATTNAAVTGRNSNPGGAANQLDFIDDDLPLLSDSEHYNFGDGEEVSAASVCFVMVMRVGSVAYASSVLRMVRSSM